MLTLYRRHLKGCPHLDQGRAFIKCSCPIWYDGVIDGKRVSKSLDTRDWARAMRKLGSVEDPAFGLRPCAQPGCAERVQSGRCARHTRSITDAVTAYHETHQDVSEGTRRNRRRSLAFFEDHAIAAGAKTVDQIELEMINTFRTARKISARTWIKELEILRHFFRFCLKNRWAIYNVAEDVPMPKNLKPAPREPYEPNEITKIIAACDVIGQWPYERLRARAIALLLRYTALRISDVATLRRDRVRHGEILVRTTKNGKPVKLPVPADLKAALELLPLPRGAEGANCAYFFWSGNGSKRAVIRDVTRTMATVYEKSGVADACSHRFRHTIATEVLEMGGSIEEAADILGDSPGIILKHYVKWSRGRQARISDLLARIWKNSRDVSATQTFDDSQPLKNEWDGMVDGMGFEPTTPALRTPCSPN